MKKILKQIILTGAISCCSLLTFAQGAYMKIGGGYNFGIASASGTNYYANYIRDTQTGAIIGGEEIAELVKINYGKGLTGSAAIGYMFNNSLGTELDICYLNGGKNKISSTNFSNDRSFSEQVYKYSSSAKMIFLQPSLILSTELSGPYSVYGKFGLIVAKGVIYDNHYSLTHDSNNETFENTLDLQYQGGWGFGLMAGLGLNYKLNEKLSLFSELKINSLSYAPNQFKVKKSTFNGETFTPSNPIRLVNEYSKTFPNQNSAQIKSTFPFSSAGLNIGLKYNF